jgi:HEAT repeat protein
MLRESTYPDEREWAANHLTEAGRRGAAPAAAGELARAAVQDQTPGVRAACLRGLRKLGARAEAAAAVQRLRTDPDEGVRTEAEEVGEWLRGGVPAAAARPAPGAGELRVR